MTKISSSRYKVSRRLGISIWGDSKDALNKRNYRPGQHGSAPRMKLSYYGMKLKEKQKIKSYYGRITETQMRNIFEIAKKLRGNTAENFVSLLERRLDMVVYRLGFAPTIFAARQLVSHKHIQVNGKVVNIGSYRLKDGEVISLTEKGNEMTSTERFLNASTKEVPQYLKLDRAKKEGSFVRSPESISEVPFPFTPNIEMIVEHYSR